ncbi:DUF5134 domain-containing protein [Streptomyces sp. NPDC090075]|uniref:DUF5134 domain-containing protein n=1 Tax=Streptomyces sp. NPDC090075 TaxID=3365937 RepID=UPI003818839C
MDTPADVANGMLTALFAVAASHALLHGVRSPGTGRRDRVDHLLHFAMAAAMAAMPWNPVRPPSGPALTVLFTAAALWFPLTALHHRTADTVAAIAGRLPPAAGMAAMAWMLHTPHGGDALPHGTPAAHHIAAAGRAAGTPVPAAVVTGLLTAYLLACAIRSLTRPMPALRSATDTAHRAAATDPYGHLRDGAMALGTAVMLLMPH